MLHEGRVTQDVFVEFLQRLMQRAKQPIILAVDRHPIHKAANVKKHVKKQDGRCQLREI